MDIRKSSEYSFKERAAGLVAQMTLEEKIIQLSNNAAPIPRLEVPGYNYWSEASHGFFGPLEFTEMDVTSYPVCLAMSQSWDRDKMKAVASAIGDECRALHNEKGNELHMWCPTINLARDPRNGRSDENFGEDPVLAGKMAASYIQGMQGEDEKYIKVIATPKHYALNSSENNRHNGSSNVDEATLREYYTKPFEYAVKEGKAESIMTSYNRVNGVPVSVNEKLLTELLREEWGFDGFVVSDCGAVADCYTNPMFSHNTNMSHYYCKSLEEASALSLRKGTDLSCGIEHKKALLQAMEQGLINEDVLDRALIRIFTSRFRLGLFDDRDCVPYSKLGKESIASDSMADLSVSMANDSIVLLKNDKNLLPLDKSKLKSVLVVGPNAIYRQLGGYSAGQSPIVDTIVNVMPLDGIRNELADTDISVRYEKGWCTEAEFKPGGFMALLPGFNMEDVMLDFTPPEGVDPAELRAKMMAGNRHKTNDPDHQGDDKILFARALEAAKDVDAVLVIAGTDDLTASEEHDRETLELPYQQDEKIQALLEVNPNTVVILATLGAVTGEFFEKSHTVVNAHYAGQAQGTAIANILFGKVIPNAKLTATWYKDLKDLPHVNDYGIKKQDTCDQKARTYMYMERPVLFPFGYGLSYTSFEYDQLSTDKKEYNANDTIRVSLKVTNLGKRDGAEIVQLYVTRQLPEKVRDNKPIRQLKGFEKVWLKAGESKIVDLEIPIRDITFWNNLKNKMVVEPGQYRIEAGSSSADIRCQTRITLTGEWDAPLYNVYAVADKYIYAAGQTGNMGVSAALEDAAHLTADEYQLAFTSTDETVALVDEQGCIKARGTGTALIKAAVTYKGKTVFCELPIAVK